MSPRSDWVAMLTSSSQGRPNLAVTDGRGRCHGGRVAVDCDCAGVRARSCFGVVADERGPLGGPDHEHDRDRPVEDQVRAVRIESPGDHVRGDHHGEHQSPHRRQLPVDLLELWRGPQLPRDRLAGVLLGERHHQQRAESDRCQEPGGDRAGVAVDERSGRRVGFERDDGEGDEREHRAKLEHLRAAGPDRARRNQPRRKQRPDGGELQRRVLGDECEDDPWDEREVDPRAGPSGFGLS